MDDVSGLIFDIKKLAVHDGPGIRTTIFFKGCPLRCKWCHNPESILPQPELILFETKCIGCGECVSICAQHAHAIREDGSRLFDRSVCLSCGDCARVCYAEALVMEGRVVTLEDVMTALRKDMPFYESSEGGITLSGGEPLAQADFALALLKQCKREDLHCVLDTSGYGPWHDFEKCIQFVDLILYDIKHMDPNMHRRYTGVSNDLILENLAKAGKAGVPLEIRMPIIAGINDDREQITEAARFLSGISGIRRIQLLPYHRLGEAKYTRLGRPYGMGKREPLSDDQMEEVADRFRSNGTEVRVGR